MFHNSNKVPLGQGNEALATFASSLAGADFWGPEALDKHSCAPRPTPHPTAGASSDKDAIVCFLDLQGLRLSELTTEGTGEMVPIGTEKTLRAQERGPRCWGSPGGPGEAGPELRAEGEEELGGERALLWLGRIHVEHSRKSSSEDGLSAPLLRPTQGFLSFSVIVRGPLPRCRGCSQ